MTTKTRASMTALRIRLCGTKDELGAAVEKVREAFDVASVSKPVRSRLVDGEFLIYVRVRHLSADLPEVSG